MLHPYNERSENHADSYHDPFAPCTSELFPEAVNKNNHKLGSKVLPGIKKFFGVKEGKLKGQVASCLGVSTSFPFERSVQVNLPNSNDSRKAALLVEAPV